MGAIIMIEGLGSRHFCVKSPAEYGEHDIQKNKDWHENPSISDRSSAQPSNWHYKHN